VKVSLAIICRRDLRCRPRLFMAFSLLGAGFECILGNDLFAK
jgi:hypothetical protein